MLYTFKYTFLLPNGSESHSSSHECDCFQSALEALSADIVDAPIGAKIAFNSYYTVNKDYRKFRERFAFEILFNHLNSRLEGVQDD